MCSLGILIVKLRFSGKITAHQLTVHQLSINEWVDHLHPLSLTWRVTTGKALSSLHDDVWVATAAQLLVNLTVRKTAVEEVWPRSEWEGEQNVEGVYFFSIYCETVKQIYDYKWCLPPNNEFNGVSDNAVQHQSQAHSLRRRETTDQSSHWAASIFDMICKVNGRVCCLIITQRGFLPILMLWLLQYGKHQNDY